MPLLGDFLGTLLAELVIGRAQADVQAVQVAKELYRGDELLKRFPVPRFRLPTVVLRVPVAVKGPVGAPAGTPPGVQTIGPLLAPQLEAAALRVVALEVRRARIPLSVSERDGLRTRLAAAAEGIASRRTPPALHEAAKDMADATTAALGAVLGPGAPAIANLPFAVLTQLAGWRGPLARLEVAVTAAELKEAMHTIQLELTVREDALEWTVLDIGGKSQDRLVPE